MDATSHPVRLSLSNLTERFVCARNNSLLMLVALNS